MNPENQQVSSTEPISPAQTPEITNTIEKKRFSWLDFFMGFFLSASLLLAGYFAYTYFNPQTADTNTADEIEEQKDTEVKSVKHEMDWYTIEVPSDWTVTKVGIVDNPDDSLEDETYTYLTSPSGSYITYYSSTFTGLAIGYGYSHCDSEFPNGNVLDASQALECVFLESDEVSYARSQEDNALEMDVWTIYEQDSSSKNVYFVSPFNNFKVFTKSDADLKILDEVILTIRNNSVEE